jgi:hypothetical protein
MYDQYIYLIGKLKDVYKLDVEVEHRNIHVFYKDKLPLFKLFFGIFPSQESQSIVISFHIDLTHPEVIIWFQNLKDIHPIIELHDSYIEDSVGETYLGEDAVAIKNLYVSQDVLDTWLNSATVEDMQAFIHSKVLGRDRDPNKPFDVQSQFEAAEIEFQRIRVPGSEDELH